MNGYKIALYTLYALGAIVTILSIGKPRGVLTPGLALASLLSVAASATLVYLS